MDLRAEDFFTTCDNCGTHINNVFILNTVSWQKRICLCFSCVLKLRDLAHDATCEKDVTGKCDCFKGEL